ncbi:hypothetical protein DRW41_08025 [Neobacillus piezotolerans]|uniref:Uncharacterized protein n=1 Tax=Neobacillus piezotolerans TaxID=2259171 RepID=A0A3D8GTH2_9BACI|nr:hypothetical protein [Neobacillus piezotolerans]RDU37764.1 hypothetical protein DRW41_08025 [Neobacillus piezotolerans]
MRKYGWIIVLFFVAAAGVFYVKQFTMLLDFKRSAETVSRRFEFEKDFSDTKTLVDGADRIFIGEVLEEKGRGTHAGNPATFFEVRVTQNIKGALLGGVTVIQDGGYYKENGKLYLLKYENDEPLRKGQMYLFIVNLDRDGMYWAMPRYGLTPLDTEEQKHRLIEEIRGVLQE